MSNDKKVVNIKSYQEEKAKADKKAEEAEITKRILERAKKLDW